MIWSSETFVVEDGRRCIGHLTYFLLSHTHSEQVEFLYFNNYNYNGILLLEVLVQEMKLIWTPFEERGRNTLEWQMLTISHLDDQSNEIRFSFK